MKVLVCGGRDYDNEALLWLTLDKVLDKHPDIMIIHGSARGADMMSEIWAKNRQIPYWGFPARWNKFDKSAGMIRNKEMRDIAKPDACIAFRGGAGTKGMISLMREIGIKPWLVGWECE